MRKYIVSGMSCASCVQRIEKTVKKLDGIEVCSISLLTNVMGIEGTASDKTIIDAVKGIGYGIEILGNNATNNSENDVTNENLKMLADTETGVLKKRLLSSLFFLIILMYFSMGYMMWNFKVPKILDGNYLGIAIIQMLLALIIMFINKKFFINGFKGIIKLSPNMDTLVSLGSFISFAYSFVVIIMMSNIAMQGNTHLLHTYMHELYFESAGTILTLITVGKMLESMSKGKTTDALKNLIKLAPETANVLYKENNDCVEKTVSIKEIKVDDIVVVRPYEKIPVDGIIESGETAIDESALTGESIPVDKKVGDKTYQGTNNCDGFIKIVAKSVGKDTTISRIIELIKDLNATKAPITRIADKISAIFVPTIIGISILTFIIWMLNGESISFSIARSIVVLVVSCPCALGLATPVAIMVSSGVGAKNGILFKTAAAIEKLARVKVIAMDKTGTITNGKPKVVEILYNENKIDDDIDFIELSYNIEKMSEHPLAKSIVTYIDENNKSIREIKFDSFETLIGRGAKVVKNNIPYYIGNMKMIDELNIDKRVSLKASIDSNDTFIDLNFAIMNYSKKGFTPLIVSNGKKIYGIFFVADTIRQDSKNAISYLKKYGLKTCMITGDNKLVANHIADTVSIDSVYAEVLPEDKGKIITHIKDENAVAMVGDGINDAVALSAANVGIAIGGGSDIAVNSSDIVLINNNLSDVANAIKLSKNTLINIYENYFYAFIYNALLIPIAAGVFVKSFGIKMTPDFGALAMSLSSFCVVMNSLRLNTIKFDCKNIKKEKINKSEVNNMEKEFKIKGMECCHCEKAVEKELMSIDGVTKVVASHEKGNAIVTMSKDIADEVIKNAIINAGYEV